MTFVHDRSERLSHDMQLSYECSWSSKSRQKSGPAYGPTSRPTFRPTSGLQAEITAEIPAEIWAKIPTEIWAEIQAVIQAQASIWSYFALSSTYQNCPLLVLLFLVLLLTTDYKDRSLS